ncbi:cardioacceleratory peptide receptor-like [Haliotis rubra]|uniref:cardioacceleratory peptide receptor-like n=1 Tax=Haliotis rubra TaxID=36100 RepID=UPI001EE5E57E|nr:cardioacceleratory peptide receptor-like [Haliotis rubra]
MATMDNQSRNNSEEVSSYENNTSSMYEFYTAPQLVLVSMLLAFIVIGNLCVLAAIQLSKTGRKTRMNFFIMHLAIADLLVGLMCVMTDLLSKITIEWYAGNFMCKVIQYLQAVVTYASSYVLVSLSIDRYDAVARPMNFSRSAYQARMLVSMAWLLSLLFALPTIFIYAEDVREDKKQCWMDFPSFWHWQLYFTLNAIVTFILPALIIAACYVAIIFIIWTKGQDSVDVPEQRNLTDKDYDSLRTERPRVTLQCNRMNAGRGVIPQAKIRTIKMTLIIVIVFILCWSPFFVYNILDLYDHIPSSNALSTLIQSAAPLNSAANPIIYGIFSTRICRNLRGCRGGSINSHSQSRTVAQRTSINPTDRRRRIPVFNCLAKAFCRCKTPKKSPVTRVMGHPTSLTDQTCCTMDNHSLKRCNESTTPCLAHRRPSGLPIVRKTLTPKETLLLKNVTEIKMKSLKPKA